MTVVNAAASTEAVNITLVSDQFTFANRDAGGVNNAAQYSAITSGGDDMQYTGAGIDFNGNPPVFGSATTIECDLSNNNFGAPDVVMTQITAALGAGAIQAAQMAAVTGSALNFFNEVMSFNDTMTGSAFDDTFKSGGGSDTLQMGAGNDSAFGGAGVDAINGDAGNDQLFGEADNDVLNGGSGNDTMNGGTGADIMNGSTGNDVYVVDNVGDIATDVFFGGIDRVDSTVSHTLSSQIENLTLTGAAAINGTGNGLGNVINGNAANNVLTGNGGNDQLNGNAGNDVLNGGTGNDRLNGGAGIDNMTGGTNNDVYVVDNLFDVTIEAAGGGIDRVDSSVTEFLAANIENLTLTGAAAINGTGNALNNSIVGNGAANDLTGGGGADILNAGGSDDDYNYLSTGDSTSFAQDRILSFTFGGAATGDKIDCSVIDANTTVAGNQAFAFTAGPGGAGTLWVDNAAVGSDSIIFANVDADASAEFQCAVADGATDESFWLAIDFIL